MIFTAHRINTIKELRQIPAHNGIEIDVRDCSNNLILSHNPFKNGVTLNKFLNFYKHKFIIVNVKSEGIEKKIYNLLKKKKISNFFFLDTSFPFLIKYSKTLSKKFALRISDLESSDTLFNIKSRINWVWLDCFKEFNISIKILKKIKRLNYKICIVSPNLHGRNISNKDKVFFKKIKKNKIKIDMICEKKPKFLLWKKLFIN